MKKILLGLGLILTALVPTSTFCSERSWLQSKLDSFRNTIATRHTYRYNSFEHLRDRALLFLLPPDTAQIVLALQRANMQNFLKENEQDALEKLIKLHVSDEQTLEIIKEEIKKSQRFNLHAMQTSHKVVHDPHLPAAWLTAIKEQCKKRGINIKSLHLVASHDEPTFLADATSNICTDSDNYNPATIRLNINSWNILQKKYIQQGYGNLADDQNALKACIDVQLTHIIENHSAQWKIIMQHIDIKKMMKSLSLKKMNAVYYRNWRAAQQKTADTLVACTDQENSKNSIQGPKISTYRDNLNDMKVIHANWQTSHAITNCQQLKNSITQKLNGFPKFFA